MTEKLAQTLANPLIPLTKKYDIIEKVYGFESEPKLKMCIRDRIL